LIYQPGNLFVAKNLFKLQQGRFCNYEEHQTRASDKYFYNMAEVGVQQRASSGEAALFAFHCAEFESAQDL